MRLTGTACAETLSRAEDAGTRERAKGNAGGVRVEPKVRPSTSFLPPEQTIRLDLSLLEWEREFMPTTPKGKGWSYCVYMKDETLNGP